MLIGLPINIINLVTTVHYSMQAGELLQRARESYDLGNIEQSLVLFDAAIKADPRQSVI